MTVTKENYQTYYEQYASRGFRVIDARQYYVKERNMSPDLEQMIATTWSVSGLQVFGYTITHIGVAEERKLGYRETHTHEFWIYDAQNGPVNLANVYPNGYQLTDSYGNALDPEDAYEILDVFATAASYYPHVFLAAEYAEARNYLNGMMNLPPVTSANYQEYLEHIRSQMQRREFTFTGKITTEDEMHLAYESMEGMDDYEKRAKKH